MLGGRRDLEISYHDAPWSVRIAHLTDLHLDCTGVGPQRIGDALSRIEPDLVVMTGDYFGRRVMPAALDALCAVLSPYPVFSVLGNHDHTLPERDRARLIGTLSARAGLLRNQTANYGDLVVYGMDDPVTRHAASECPKADLVLAHSPDLPMPLREVPAALVLCGHYHGGQVRVLPPRWIARLFLPRDPLARQGHLSGFMPGGPPARYVSRGLGESGIGLRLFCAPEIAVFGGKAGDKAGAGRTCRS
jgi:predicted MPP superfamily phosphohydrolase